MIRRAVAVLLLTVALSGVGPRLAGGHECVNRGRISPTGAIVYVRWCGNYQP